MDRAAVRKAALTPSLLAVDRMDDRQRWKAGLERATNLRARLKDGRDVAAFRMADELYEIMFLLYHEGIQLQILSDGKPLGG